MAPSPEIIAIIKDRIAALSKTKRTGMNFIDFSTEFGRLLSRALIDKEDLIAAGYPWLEKEIADGLRYFLIEEHADRILAEGMKSDDEKLFYEKMSKAETYENSLWKSARFISKRTTNESFDASLRKISPSTSQMEVLNNVIMLADLVGTELELASLINPGQIPVNQGYLDLVKSEAHIVIDLYDKIHSAPKASTLETEIHHKVMTLCMDSEELIIEYADSAFQMAPEYFNEHYVNHVRREKYRAKQRQAQKEAEAGSQENENLNPASDQVE